MIPVIIIAIIGLIIFLAIRKKKELHPNTNSKTTYQNSPSSPTTQAKQKFQSKISTLPFPDRIDALVWHINAIEKGLSIGDLDLANLSYAKLIESIRQQTITEKGKFDDALNAIRDEYTVFRNIYGLEYPQQFLPPSESKRKAAITQPKAGGQDNTLVFLETLNFIDLPKSVINNIDIVRTVSQWNELGFKPKKKEYDGWNDIKREERYFEFVGASATDPKHKASLETGKRITSKPYFIKTLVDQGVSLEEFVENGEDLKYFIEADNSFENKNYEKALQEIELALSIKTLDDYTELRKDIQVKLGNETTVEQQFQKHEFDIDSPIHTGEIYDWLKAFLKNKRFDRVVAYIKTTNDTLDKLSKGIIKPKIYGQQSGDWYTHKKEDFQKNIYRAFDIDLINLEQTEKSVEMLTLFINIYIGKEIKPIENVADLYVNWGLKEQALQLYNLCLTKLGDDDKPRVRARLAKKISALS